MTGLSVRFEVLHGRSLADACVDLCLAAHQQGVIAKAQFNGMLLLAGPDDDPAWLVEAVFVAISRGETVASSQHRLSDRLRIDAKDVFERLDRLTKPVAGTA